MLATHYLFSHNLRLKKAFVLTWDFAPTSMNTQVI
jgi:hypothetical protein